MNLQFEQTDFNQEILFYLVFGMSKLSIKLTTDKILGEQNINQIYCIINLCNQGGLIVVFSDHFNFLWFPKHAAHLEFDQKLQRHLLFNL